MFQLNCHYLKPVIQQLIKKTKVKMELYTNSGSSNEGTSTDLEKSKNDNVPMKLLDRDNQELPMTPTASTALSDINADIFSDDKHFKLQNDKNETSNVTLQKQLPSEVSNINTPQKPLTSSQRNIKKIRAIGKMRKKQYREKLKLASGIVTDVDKDITLIDKKTSDLSIVDDGDNLQ